MLTRREAIATVCWTLLWTGTAIGQGVPPALPDVRVGDRWVYETRDDLTGEVRDTITVAVIDVTETEISTRHSRKPGERPRSVIYNRYWARIDDNVWRFNPNDQLPFKPDLAVGQSWQIRLSARNMRSGTILNAKGTARVTGAESIRTAAGTFDVLRVESETEQAQGRDAGIISYSKLTFWYAPDIARWVRKTTEIRRDGRIRDKVTENLTSYERKR